MYKNKGDAMKRFLFLILPGMAISLVLLSAACCTKPEKGAIRGKVILVNDSSNATQDAADYSGATIALYHTVVLDTTMFRLNSEYPQIGVSISQETAFDHRLQAPLATTESAADGSFSFGDVEEGSYNMVVFKEQWGIRYLYSIVVGQQEVDTGNIALYPEVILPATITGSYIFKSDHCYLAQGDVSLIGNVQIEARAQMHIAPGYRMKFYGLVSTPNELQDTELWKVSTASSLYSTAGEGVNADARYFSVEFYANSSQIMGGYCRYGSTGVTLLGSGIGLSQSLIRDCGNGVSVRSGDNVLSYLSILDIDQTGINASFNTSEEFDLTSSIIMNTHTGIRIYTGGTYNVSNCYFFGCWDAIIPSICTGSITHNAFDQNTADITQESVQIPTDIAYNNFHHSKAWGIRPSKYAVINNNNFYTTGSYYIYIRGGGTYNSIVLADIDATMNYWGVSDIDTFIMDGNDNASYPDDPCAFYVHYLPKRNSRVPDAGIQ